MKVRIFALAKELGLDSKELIDLANEAGVVVKNSALASISPEERDLIVAHVKQEGSSAKPEQEPEMAPVRERAHDPNAKVREMRSMSPRPQVRANKQQEEEVETSTVAEVAETATAVAAESTASPVETQDGPPVEETVSEQVVAETEAATEAVETEDTVAEQASETEVPEAEGAVETSEAEETDEDGPKKPGIQAISRDDYMPKGGGGSLREMRPRGNMSGGKGNGNKPKPKVVLPNIAAQPKYEAPKKKTETKKEVAAQKPDMKLTPDLLAGKSPLASHLQKTIDQRGRKGDKEDDEKGRKGLGATDKRDRKRGSRRLMDELEGGRNITKQRRPYQRRQRKRSNKEIVRKTEAVVELPITVRTLAEAIGHPTKAIMKILWADGNMVNINDSLTEEQALEISLELGVEVEFKRQQTAEERMLEFAVAEDAPDTLEQRPPIVTILGHVDHGKTSLLDKIRSANVTDGEAGGITQHIASYQVTHNDHKVTFVDTPGHAAFGEMRARGANVTDIIVLVVAADDGVMPQTKECISHAKSSGAPIIVAMNKCDLPDSDEQRVLQDLAANDILPAEWGGEVEVIRTSAMTGQGIEELLETILLTAELHEYKANPTRNSMGVCLEAFMDEGRGVMSWMVVQHGTLKVGDVVLCGEAFGRVRALYDDHDNEILAAPPSTPVKVAGLDSVPAAGQHFYVLDEIEEAREIAETRTHRDRAEVLAKRRKPISLDDLLSEARMGTATELPIILKADAPGSLEALRSELDKLDHPEVKIQIIHEGVGGVNESDVYLASASGAIIIAFHVIAEDRAEILAGQEGVDIRRFRIIYEVTDTIKRSLEGLLEPEEKEVATGRALVLRAFSFSKVGKIAGCRVLNGTIDRNNRVHVIRDQTVINNYPIASLRREKDDVKEVREGMECGIRLDNFNDVKEGDLLEAYRVETVKRTLDS